MNSRYNQPILVSVYELSSKREMSNSKAHKQAAAISLCEISPVEVINVDSLFPEEISRRNRKIKGIESTFYST